MKKKAATTSEISVIPAMTKVQPKPTKREIARAMLERARVKWREKENALTEKLSIIHAALFKAALAEVVSGNYSSPYLDTPSSYDVSTLAHIRLDATSPEIGRLCKEYRDTRKQSTRFDEAEVKRAIAAVVFRSQQRVDEILAITENVRALDAMLGTINL